MRNPAALEAPEHLLTAEQAAERLNLNVRWLKDRARERTIPHMRFGRRIRYSERDLRAWAEQQAQDRP